MEKGRGQDKYLFHAHLNATQVVIAVVECVRKGSGRSDDGRGGVM